VEFHHNWTNATLVGLKKGPTTLCYSKFLWFLPLKVL
jgi:hypothetical protein